MCAQFFWLKTHCVAQPYCEKGNSLRAGFELPAEGIEIYRESVLDYSENEKPDNAIARNTAATRAIATFILGSIPCTPGGSSLIAFGFMSVALSPDGRCLPIVFLAGLGVTVYGAIRTPLRTRKELKCSDFA